MSDDRLARLVAALSKQTAEGGITWTTTGADTVYQVSFPKQSIQIFLRNNPNTSGSDVVLNIRNGSGQVVESFADTDVVQHMANAYDVMMALYEKARRQALGADKAIDDILKELGDDIPF